MAVTKRLNWLKWLYPGEGGLQSEQGWLIDKRRNHMKGDHSAGVVSGLKVIETVGTPDLEVHVQVGRAIGGDGEEIVLDGIVDVDLSSYATGGAAVKIVAEYAEVGTDPYIVPETAASQDKFLQDDPTITVITGAPAANQIVLAEVDVSNGATQITDAVDPVNPGTDEIDHRNRIESNVRVRGLRFVNEVPTYADKSTVTVGESECDFDDLEEAISFVSNLTRSATRQRTILLFEKENGQEWSITSAITVPTWTHVIGVGKPTLKLTAVVANVFTMNQGSRLENIWIDTDDSWTDTVIDIAGAYCELRNVTVRYEHNSTKNLWTVHVLDNSDYCTIDGLTLLPYSGDATKSAWGILITGDWISVHNLKSTGYSYRLQVQAQKGNFQDVHLFCKTVNTCMRVYESYNTFTGFVIDGDQDEGMEASGNYCVFSDFVFISSVATWLALLVTGDHCHFTNMTAPDAKMQISTAGSYAQFSNCRFTYDNDDGASVVTVNPAHCIFVGCTFDRGGRDWPCINPAQDTADYGQVVGCKLLNTGTSSSLPNVSANRIDWISSGNMVDVGTAAGNGWVVSGEKVI